MCTQLHSFPIIKGVLKDVGGGGGKGGTFTISSFLSRSLSSLPIELHFTALQAMEGIQGSMNDKFLADSCMIVLDQVCYGLVKVK